MSDNVTTAPPPLRRRGRGVFNQNLRADTLSTNPSTAAVGDGASVFTTVTTAVLPAASSASTLPRTIRPPEEDLAAAYAGQKKDIPLNIRENFGVCENDEEADTVRQLLFRGEKRRRYCIIVGELQNPLRPITLKLFGHKGLKPFKLQNKLIRLVNISVGRPRLPRPANPDDGEEQEEEEEEEAEETHEKESDTEDTTQTRHAKEEADTMGSKETEEKAEDEEEEKEGVKDAEKEEVKDAHATEHREWHVDPSTCHEKDEERNTGIDETAEKSPERQNELPIAEEEKGETHEESKEVMAAEEERSRPSSSHANMEGHEAEHEPEHEDVDAYADRDEVVPLTVETRGSANMGQLSSAANSPVLTAKRFETLESYFFNELKFLLGMQDIRMQHVSICLNLGAAYCCLAREGSYSTPLRYATFGEFVQRMNEESMQLYFLKDAPICVSRAVDKECGALQSEANFSLVKICFFSNERQSRSVARAMWDAHENRFVLLDMENSGVTFTWIVFSVDETGVKLAPGLSSTHAKPTEAFQSTHTNPNPHASAAETGLFDVKDGPPAADWAFPPTEANPSDPGAASFPGGRKKTAAFPFEVELHAYRRWKQHTEHPAAPIAEAILDKLSLAEHNLIHYGSTVGYEHMDLSHVCEVDAESEDFNVESIIVEHTSRVKPRGTDITVDSTSSLWIENFAAARAMRERLAQGLHPNHALSQQMHAARARVRGGRGRGVPVAGMKAQPATPASRLTFFRSRGSTVHWKLRPGRSTEENLAPLSEAMRFAQQVLNTANEIERTSARGGAAPDAL